MRPATRIRLLAKQIIDIAEESGVDYDETVELVSKNAKEIYELADEADARTGLVDPLLETPSQKRYRESRRK